MTITSDAAAIHCHQLVKRFGENLALDHFELEVAPGQILSLLGPSGCGKTTALRIIAGFEDPDSGSLAIDGVTVVDPAVNLPPERRRVGMVFQDYALFPHMTVAGNVGFGLQPQPDAGRIAEVLELVGLATHSDRMPHELSGGEQQRVALARALAPRPALILLDEPFSNLDAGLRDRMRRDVRHILKDAGTTAVFVTHDQEEALATSDVVAVMREGRVLQTDTPQRLYRSPVDPWVADFVGDGEFFDGTADIGFVETPLGTFPQTTTLRGAVTVMVRPEWIHPTRSGGGRAVVVDQEFYGHDQLIVLELPDGRRVNSRVGASPTFVIGDRADVGIDEIVVFAKDA
ncbi:MAG: ABC transporter ATP-binding protein [Acidimicrobiia bacterium]|nr:ABC transporter ATP-binding protein [Acidimicrobiia bacterium]